MLVKCTFNYWWCLLILSPSIFFLLVYKQNSYWLLCWWWCVCSLFRPWNTHSIFSLVSFRNLLRCASLLIIFLSSIHFFGCIFPSPPIDPFILCVVHSPHRISFLFVCLFVRSFSSLNWAVNKSNWFYVFVVGPSSSQLNLIELSVYVFVCVC